MNLTDLNLLELTEVAHLIQTRKTSPVELTQAMLGQGPDAFVALTRFTSPFDMAGSPTIALPSCFTPENTPISIQHVSRHWDEGLRMPSGLNEREPIARAPVAIQATHNGGTPARVRPGIAPSRGRRKPFRSAPSPRSESVRPGW